MTSTLSEYLDSQEELVREAAEALPHEFSRCTYTLGPLRQAVYLCSTCPEARGICSACSIACHTDHEQVELFPKRNFRCDCPTTAIAHPCKLHPRSEDINTDNKYGQNFQGHFCRCGRTYDPLKEREAMIQCLACEDWFHESCCNLRKKPPLRGESTPEPTDHHETVDGEASSLPPPLISEDDYESFVCGSCVLANPILTCWAGSPGAIMVVRYSPAYPWRRFDGQLDQLLQDKAHDNARNDSASSSSSDDSGPSHGKLVVKRQATPPLDGPPAKRPRSSSATSDADAPAPANNTATTICVTPAGNIIAEQVFTNDFFDRLFDGVHADPKTHRNGILGTGDIFLTEGFRERWCRCNSCQWSLRNHPYLLNEEETYEPPADPDSMLSLEELGMRALERIPRDKAIEGIHAFNEMKDDLLKFLRPFAREGKVVDESDVREFFAALSEGRKNEQASNGG